MSTVDSSMLHMKFYRLSPAAACQLLQAVEGAAMNLPFEQSPEEKEILEYKDSAFILGRSGSGYTGALKVYA